MINHLRTYKKIVGVIFALSLTFFCLTSVFARSNPTGLEEGAHTNMTEENNANPLTNTTISNGKGASHEVKSEAQFSLTDSTMTTEEKNLGTNSSAINGAEMNDSPQGMHGTMQHDWTSNSYPPVPSMSLSDLHKHTSSPSLDELYSDPNYHTEIYGGSSTIISGNDILTTNNQYPQNQINSNSNYINNNQTNNNMHYNQNASQNHNQDYGQDYGQNSNSNSNAGGFYFNMTGPNGSSMSMGTFFGNSSHNSNDSSYAKGSSQIINDNESRTLSSKPSSRGSSIIRE